MTFTMGDILGRAVPAVWAILLIAKALLRNSFFTAKEMLIVLLVIFCHGMFTLEREPTTRERRFKGSQIETRNFVSIFDLYCRVVT